MKRTLFIATNPFRISTLALALAVTLGATLVSPQTAKAQRTFRRGGVGGGVGSFLGGRRAVPNGITLPTSHPTYQLLPAPSFPAPNPRAPIIPTPPSAYPYNYATRPYLLSGLGWNYYFPTRSVYFPNYYVNGTVGATLYSPYYWYGTYPPYIGAGSIGALPAPINTYVPSPVYSQEGVYRGDYPNDGTPNFDPATYYLDAQQYKEAIARQKSGQSPASNIKYTADVNSDFKAAIADLNTAWNEQNIQALARHVHGKEPVAVYLGGEYQYSLKGADYLNMTRDALSSTNTVRFAIETVQQKEQTIYTVRGHHTYADRAGVNHTVLVSYVLKKENQYFFITQVDSTPTKLE